MWLYYDTQCCEEKRKLRIKIAQDFAWQKKQIAPIPQDIVGSAEWEVL